MSKLKMDIATQDQILNETVFISYSANTFQKGMHQIIYPPAKGGCPRGVMVKAMDCRIVVSEFEFQ